MGYEQIETEPDFPDDKLRFDTDDGELLAGDAEGEQSVFVSKAGARMLRAALTKYIGDTTVSVTYGSAGAGGFVTHGGAGGSSLDAGAAGRGLSSRGGYAGPGSPNVFADLFTRLTSPAVEKPRRGARISMTTRAYVTKINDDGTYQLGETNDPFADPITLDKVPASRFGLVEQGPAEVMVGDRIRGAQVQSTPWRRGTILSLDEAEPHDRRWVLLGNGEWSNLSDGAPRRFDGFTGPWYIVEHAPGKATRP